MWSRMPRLGDRLVRMVPALLPVCLAVTAVASTLHFKRAGEDSIEARYKLEQVRSELYLEDALEWQAISPRDPSFDPGPRLEESVARARDLLDATVVLGLDKATAERIEALLLRYHRLVRRELELLSSPGHPKQPRSSTRSRPTPRSTWSSAFSPGP